ncbi:hypothetical protein TWF970_007510 [Orbilia oligospora]|uniref:Uncharacterized protein n=1 Tax=Orbilia oligospora TaxID=2813651 RepID=A0A7C8R780_ORBOL|nr:hypothetical protein TWF970_007510 [Orbilia oligospora]
MPHLFSVIDSIFPYIFIIFITTSINYFTIRKEMAKISVAKSNRCECRKRGPISKKGKAGKISQPPRVPKGRMSAPYSNIDYKHNVLAADNIRILGEDTIFKLDREDRSGQNILDLYYGFKNMIVGQREHTTKIGSLVETCHRILKGYNDLKASRNPDWDYVMDESLTSQENALEIDEYLFRSTLRLSARQRRSTAKQQLEQKFQDLLIAEVEILENLMLNQGDLQGGIGPKHVVANIKDHIKPDYLCGYSNAQSALSIPSETWDKIPRSLCVLSPNSEESAECLFLPFLALELKWRGTSERVVKNQLARCLSILAERQAELERISNSVSTTPIFGLTGVERDFTLWVMFRYESNYGGEVRTHYDMCELDSYDLTSKDDVEGFRAAMTNIHDWVENERKAHFMRCMNSVD